MFEIVPSGEVLTIYFSTPKDPIENDVECTFVQACLWFGAEEWELPQFFMSIIGANDQSALLWNDNKRLRFFVGGRDISDFVPFLHCYFGGLWNYLDISCTQVENPKQDVTPRSISNIFRDPKGSIYLMFYFNMILYYIFIFYKIEKNI